MEPGSEKLGPTMVWLENLGRLLKVACQQKVRRAQDNKLTFNFHNSMEMNE